MTFTQAIASPSDPAMCSAVSFAVADFGMVTVSTPFLNDASAFLLDLEGQRDAALEAAVVALAEAPALVLARPICKRSGTEGAFAFRWLTLLACHGRAGRL